MISKILFKLRSFIVIISDKYRLLYLKHVYGGQLIIHEGIQFGKDSDIVFFPGGKFASLTIGFNCIFRQRCILALGSEGHMLLGNNNFFNNNCSITCLGNITIGDNNLFGENVKMYDHNHEYKNRNMLIREQGFKVGEIKIGNNCWFGSNCVILNNVTIGDNVVVGANVLVHKSIPSNSIVKSVSNLVIEPIEIRK